MTEQLTITTDDIDTIIIKENNKELQQIEKDLLDLCQLNTDLAAFICEQSEDLSTIEITTETIAKNSETAISDIHIASTYQKDRNWLTNTAIALTSTTVSLFSWLGGPIVGIPTTALALSTGGIIIYKRVKD